LIKERLVISVQKEKIIVPRKRKTNPKSPKSNNAPFGPSKDEPTKKTNPVVQTTTWIIAETLNIQDFTLKDLISIKTLKTKKMTTRKEKSILNKLD